MPPLEACSRRNPDAVTAAQLGTPLPGQTLSATGLLALAIASTLTLMPLAGILKKLCFSVQCRAADQFSTELIPEPLPRSTH